MEKHNDTPVYVPPVPWKEGATPLTPEERAALLASIDRQIDEIDTRRSQAVGPKPKSSLHAGVWAKRNAT